MCGKDPVCLAACALYAVNRWILPLSLKGPFLRYHFADTLLIPAALPWMLWLQQKLRLREETSAPQFQEIFVHWMIWSVAAEWVGPTMFAHATGDPRDVVAYAGGGLLAGLFWRMSS